MSDRMDQLQGSINERQDELHSVTTILANKAARRARWATASKVIVIALGAFEATKSAADQFLGEKSHLAMITYTLVGLMIATVAALEAAFKNEVTAAELTLLATAGQSTVRQVDSRWQREIGGVSGDGSVEAALSLIELQDAKLTELQEKAAKLGVNITLEVRKLVQRDAGAATASAGASGVEPTRPYSA
jgi:hypothetical protein